MLSDVEKRIRRARQRLSLSNQEVGGALPRSAVAPRGGPIEGSGASGCAPSQGGIKPREPSEPTDERVIVLNERIQGLLQQVEQLGCEGKVEEAQGVMKLCDQLKEERRALDKDSDTAHWLKVGRRRWGRRFATTIIIKLVSRLKKKKVKCLGLGGTPAFVVK